MIAAVLALAAATPARAGNLLDLAVVDRDSGQTLPTYASVADKLKSSDNSSEGLLRSSDGWIKNHGAFRG